MDSRTLGYYRDLIVERKLVYGLRVGSLDEKGQSDDKTTRICRWVKKMESSDSVYHRIGSVERGH